MSNSELTALCHGLIARLQRYDLLPTDSEELADELQSIAADEYYISKCALMDFI